MLSFLISYSRLPSLSQTVTKAELFAAPAAAPCFTDQFSMETLLCRSVGPDR